MMMMIMTALFHLFQIKLLIIFFLNLIIYHIKIMDKATQTEAQPNNDNNDKTHDETTKSNENQDMIEKLFKPRCFIQYNNKDYYKDRIFDEYNIR